MVASEKCRPYAGTIPVINLLKCKRVFKIIIGGLFNCLNVCINIGKV